MSIIESLRQEHRDIEDLLRVLEEELDIFDRGERPDYEIMQAIVGYLQDYPDCCHHPKENMIFARLKARDPSVAEYVGDLEAEHHSESQRLERVAYAIWRILTRREVARDKFDEVMRDFIDKEREHMRMEERVFFPSAVKVLQAEDWAIIDAGWSDRHDSLFNVGMEERCQSLRQRILLWQQDNQARLSAQES